MLPTPSSESNVNLKPIACWLFTCCVMILLMVIIGGLTRLTGSGLSMVQWAPILGWFPPFTEADWLEVFAQYRQSPEFLKINWEMDLAGFKSIYWLEYIHRLIGRITGLVFLLPFLYFLGKRRIDRTMAWQFALMFFIGALQGGMGWYMVKSGLVDNPHVSQYRLTAHLGIAVALYAYMLWVALGLFFSQRQRAADLPRHPLLTRAIALTALIFLTILSGGFVAGLDAGMAFNTFPLMNDEWIPEGILFLQPAYLNFFENIATVQWDHRLLAVILFFSILAFWWLSRAYSLSKPARIAQHLLLLMMLIQIALGISTLLLMVPTPLASAHQTGAVLLFTISLFLTHRLYHAAS
ncbi:COX15/CtaA family protein [Candidatus Magnetaquicoccus inordinatus]|uniref:COX15/CtaA family protein n=1 Tax=Candidatus Magnetaquicoccus inordinatus TaxID=2496818 RepID=UPI001D0ECD84|nr:COX15/CtaA family protein [Candidatus Magnetaquicoccus inordinatus]